METTELRFTRPRWLIAFGLLRPLLFAVAMLGYGRLLGGGGGWFVFYGVVLVLVFGWPVVVGLVSFRAQVTGPASGLTREGVQVRTRPWRRRLVTIPWPEVTMLWFGHVGSRRYLLVQADPRGPHADEWDPRGRRFTRHARPLALFVPKARSADDVSRAVAALSDGTVTMADRGPDESTDGEGWPQPNPNPFRDRRVSSWRSVPMLALVVVIGVPFALNVAPPWYQPWWPGVAAVTTLPDACAVVAGEQAAALDVSGRRRTVDSPSHHECEYTVPKGDLTVILERRHAFSKSGSAAAAERLDEIAGKLGGPFGTVSGLGDEAVMVANPPGSTTLIDRGVVRLVTRRANVVLVILYGAEKEPAVAQDAVLATARAALANLDVR